MDLQIIEHIAHINMRLEDALLDFNANVGVILTSQRQFEQVVHGMRMPTPEVSEGCLLLRLFGC